MAVAVGRPSAALRYNDVPARAAQLTLTTAGGADTLWPEAGTKTIYGPGLYRVDVRFMAWATLKNLSMQWWLESSTDAAAWTNEDPGGTDYHTHLFTIANDNIPLTTTLYYGKTTAVVEYLRVRVIQPAGTNSIVIKASAAGAMSSYARVLKVPTW